MAAVLKTAVVMSHRGFESLSLRHVISQDIGIPLNPQFARRVRGGGPGGLPVGWYDLEGSRMRARRSSPVAAWTTRMSRSWTSRTTGVRAWGSPDADKDSLSGPRR